MTTEIVKPQTYRLVWWVWITNAVNGLIILFVSLFMLPVGVWMFLMGIQLLQDADMNTISVIENLVLVCGILVIGIALVMAFAGVFFITFAFVYRVLSYLKISPEGLEYRAWPFYRMRCHWEDVDKVVRHPQRFGVKAVELRLKRGEYLGVKFTRQLYSLFRRIWGMGDNLAIPVSIFKGWKEGTLANDLREIIPHAFEADTE